LRSWLRNYILCRFGKNVKIVHFIGAAKPWKCSFDQSGYPIPNLPEDFHSVEHLKNWWAIYRTEVIERREQKVCKIGNNLTF